MVAQPARDERSPGEWILLSYRVPREPSTPRIAIWRRLKQLGVAQVGDGLVALPARAKTLELLEWVAEQVLQAEGEAIVWQASPTARVDSEGLKRQLINARETEYNELIDEIAETVSQASGPVDQRTHGRWRRQWRRIDRRDHFGTDRRDLARLAIADAAPISSRVASGEPA